MSEPILEFSDVGICYKQHAKLFKKTQKFWALRHASFSVYRGETLGVLGRNGAGKSSLLRLMADIVAPDEGVIKRADHHVLLLALQVGFLVQLSGRANAILSGTLLGLTRKDVESRMDAIIDFSELGEFIDQPVRTYSAGMRARLGFAIAMQADPDVLLIDEVIGVGDQKFRIKSKQALEHYIQSSRTVVLVSHSEEILRTYCDKIVLIDKGQVVAQGPVNEVLDRYKAYV